MGGSALTPCGPPPGLFFASCSPFALLPQTGAVGWRCWWRGEGPPWLRDRAVGSVLAPSSADSLVPLPLSLSFSFAKGHSDNCSSFPIHKGLSPARCCTRPRAPLGTRPEIVRANHKTASGTS